MADQNAQQGGTNNTPPTPTQDQKDFLGVLQNNPPKVGTPTMQLDVYGTQVDVPMTEIAKLAQKGLAADQKWQEAASARKEAEPALAFQADFKKMAEGDVEAYKRVCKAGGCSDQEIEEALQVWGSYGQGDDEGEEPIWDDGEDEDETSKGKTATPSQVGFGNLSEELQDVLLDAEVVRQEKILGKALDKDEVIGYYMKKLDPERKAALVGGIRDQIKGRLKAGERFGRDGKLLQEILPPIRNILKAAVGEQRSVPPVGLGPHYGGPSLDVHPSKKPERANSNDQTSFEDFVTQRLAWELSQGNQ